MGDTDSFKERFNRWKNGENYWDIVGKPFPTYIETYGLNYYKGGKDNRSRFQQHVNSRQKDVDFIIDTLRSNGMNDYQIAGVVGNIAQESAFNPNARNGQHTGYLQMNDNMRRHVRKIYGNDSHQNQLRFVSDVMLGNQKVGKDWIKYGGNGRYKSFNNSPAAASVYFSSQFERAGSGSNDVQRKRSAIDAFNYIQKRNKRIKPAIPARAQQYMQSQFTQPAVSTRVVPRVPQQVYGGGGTYRPTVPRGAVKAYEEPIMYNSQVQLPNIIDMYNNTYESVPTMSNLPNIMQLQRPEYKRGKNYVYYDNVIQYDPIYQPNQIM